MILKKSCLLFLVFILGLPLSYSIRASNKKDATIKIIMYKYKLKPLPNEGGYFSQSYHLCVSQRCRRTGNLDSTGIYYLITYKDVSWFHKVPYDEIFHFYQGDPVVLVQIKNGKIRKNILGSDIFHGQRVQVVVSKNTWQGAYLVHGGQYALMGTTMTPGYNGEIIGNRNDLIKKYPSAKNDIIKLTKK